MVLLHKFSNSIYKMTSDSNLDQFTKQDAAIVPSNTLFNAHFPMEILILSTENELCSNYIVAP